VLYLLRVCEEAVWILTVRTPGSADGAAIASWGAMSERAIRFRDVPPTAYLGEQNTVCITDKSDNINILLSET